MWYILAFGLELMLDSNLNIDEWLLDLPYDKSSNHLCARIKPPPERKIGTAVSLCKASQIFFHVLILNAVYHLAFPTVEDELSGDRAVAVLGLGAFLLVDQMAILLRDGFFAVLDLENPAGACLRVKYHHVKFAHRELQDEHLLLGVCQLGFQQDDVLQHPTFDLGQDALLHGGALRKRQGAECFIQQQAAN